jgi:hypothetical protein
MVGSLCGVLRHSNDVSGEVTGRTARRAGPRHLRELAQFGQSKNGGAEGRPSKREAQSADLLD